MGPVTSSFAPESLEGGRPGSGTVVVLQGILSWRGQGGPRSGRVSGRAAARVAAVSLYGVGTILGGKHSPVDVVPGCAG